MKKLYNGLVLTLLLAPLYAVENSDIEKDPRLELHDSNSSSREVRLLRLKIAAVIAVTTMITGTITTVITTLYAKKC